MWSRLLSRPSAPQRGSTEGHTHGVMSVRERYGVDVAGANW